MNTENQQNNNLGNPLVIILVLALVGLGGYVLLSKNSNGVANQTTGSSDISQTQQTQVAPTTAVNNVAPTSGTSQLATKQKECADLFNAFKLKALDAASTQQTQGNNYFSVSASDFVIGYSPKLDSCIGGYTFKLLSSGSGTASISYFIVDPKTNLGLKNWPPEYSSIAMTYENYRKILDDLTNGQLSVNNIDPKEDQTPGLMFCNTAYYKCRVGDKPMCNSNQSNSTGWCASQ